MATAPTSELFLRSCAHCGKEIPAANASLFCCNGCAAVFSILRDRGLEEYYEIRAKDRSVRASIPVSSTDGNYRHLDDPEFQALYSFPSPNGKGMRFFLDGVHCAACVWLTEKIGQYVPNVDLARLDLGNSVLVVHLTPNGSFASVAEELSRFGYRPHPVRVDELGKLQKKADHLLLAQTGVAGACSGNIMLLTTSLYAGAAGHLGETFRWVCFLLSVPVLGFSALPFYMNAFRSIRARGVSIDIPITLGILIGAVSSVYNLLTGSPYLYFDSLSMLVFLMLASRYFLRKTQQSATNSSRLAHFLTPAIARVRRKDSHEFREEPVDRIQIGDQVEIAPGDYLPVDGVVAKGRSSLNNALLTGESRMVPVGMGDTVFAGTVNGEAPLVIEAQASGSATRLGRILKSVNDDLSRKAKITTFADRMAKGFVAAVLVAVVIVFFAALHSGLHTAVNLALALSIVTCPCAFALATPLALSISLGKCAKGGVLIKGADVLERLSEVDSVYFDKTGTLTYGNYEVLGYALDSSRLDESVLAEVAVALETSSRHPVARAIVDFFSAKLSRPAPVAESWSNLGGRGVAGRVRGHDYEFVSSKRSAEKSK